LTSPEFAPWRDERDACGVGFIFRPACGHDVIADGLEALARVEHRGACGSDRDTGDGAGVMTAIPWRLLRNAGINCSPDNTDVGMAYMPKAQVDYCRRQTEQFMRSEGLRVTGWRVVPVRTEVLGSLALFTCPQMEQFFVEPDEPLSADEFEQRLMSGRKRLINNVRLRADCEDFYIASLSSRTIVYKALVRSEVLPLFCNRSTNGVLTAPGGRGTLAVSPRNFSANCAAAPGNDPASIGRHPTCVQKENGSARPTCIQTDRCPAGGKSGRCS
jgi:glutamate synthase (ferredoxin)